MFVHKSLHNAHFHNNVIGLLLEVHFLLLGLRLGLQGNNASTSTESLCHKVAAIAGAALVNSYLERNEGLRLDDNVHSSKVGVHFAQQVLLRGS